MAYTADNGDSVTDTSNTAGDNALIIANGTIGGPQELNGNQTLQGGGSTIAVRGRNSGTLANFTAPGSTPTLDTSGDVHNLTLLDSNTHVAGLAIQGAGFVGIFGGSNKDNVAITETSIDDVGNAIVFLSNNRKVTISGTTVTNTLSTGILLGSGNSDVTISGTTVTSTRVTGITAT